MGNILTKIYEAEAELESLNREIAERRKVLSQVLENFHSLNKVPAARKIIGVEFACEEAAETYDLIERLFMPFEGERLVAYNKLFSDSITYALNAIYYKGQSDFVTIKKQADEKEN